MGRGRRRRRTQGQPATLAKDSELRGRVEAALVYFAGFAVGVLAATAMRNEPSVRYHDHRPAFATAAQVLVGMLIALAIETAWFRRGDFVERGIHGGTFIVIAGGLICSLVGADLDPITQGGHAAEVWVAFCFAGACGGIAAGVSGMALIYFSRQP